LIVSIIGAQLAINFPDDIFNKILAFIMFAMLGLILWNPTKKISEVMDCQPFLTQFFIEH
jgi:hypothetical protein